MAKIEFGDLISIIKAVDTSDVVEMEVKGKRFAMCVKKQEALQAAEPVYITASAAPVPGATSCNSAAHPESMRTWVLWYIKKRQNNYLKLMNTYTVAHASQRWQDWTCSPIERPALVL